MDQPLWQNWLNIALIGFVARRAAIGVALQWETLSGLLRGAYVGVLVVCGFAGIAVWLSARWVIGSLLALAAMFTFTSLAQMGQADMPLRVWIIVQLVFGLAATAALVQLARHPST